MTTSITSQTRTSGQYLAQLTRKKPAGSTSTTQRTEAQNRPAQKNVFEDLLDFRPKKNQQTNGTQQPPKANYRALHDYM